MRGVSNVLNYWRHMSSNKVLVSVLLALAIGVLSGAFLYQQSAKPADATNHQCNQWKVMRCGMKNRQNLQNAWQDNHQGNMRAIYNSMGANGMQAAKQGVWGTVDRSGDIKVNGRVVAENAQTVYRSGNGTTPQAVPQTLRYYNMQQDRILVVMNNGQFQYGVMKNCGNPVKANPTPRPQQPERPERPEQPQRPERPEQPQPKPEPKPQPKPEPKPQMERTRVCNPKTGEIIRVRENRADQYAPVNSPQCQPEPAAPAQPEQPPQRPDQPERQPEAPAEIPATGPAQIVGSAVGMGSVAGASYYFAASRRNLFSSVFKQ